MSKLIVVTGGVCSSLGKGVATASLASLLEKAGLKIALMKCDPYINVDAGNMSPYQHGEIYVADDGTETDLNLGNYSRFTNVSLSKHNSVTTGKIYEEVIKNERAGRYNGRTIQVIPHITDEIKRRVLYLASSNEADIVIVEIGGTVGDIESIPFLEAARQLIREKGRGNALSIHLTLVPMVSGNELKTKPTQHSVKKMQEIGIQPDILLCRSESELPEDLKHKIALFCNVEKDAVFTSIDVEQSVYELPVYFHKQGLMQKALQKLNINDTVSDISSWNLFLRRFNNPKQSLKVGMLGQKNYLDDCYKSVRESLLHAAVTGNNASLEIIKIDAETIESCTNPKDYFKDIDAIIIPGSYGQRGFLGLLATVQYAREQKIPFLGIDLGMQLMAIEAARNILGWQEADSTEFIQNTEYPIISLPEEQAGLTAAGVMRLGAMEVRLLKGSLIESVYKSTTIMERHRSKYAFDKKYTEDLEKTGLSITGFSMKDNSVEVFEWKDHPWGIGVQFHPEFTSQPSKPHPLFTAFIKSALKPHET
jgi:CTP synthase